jgi:Sulfotransferase family
MLISYAPGFLFIHIDKAAGTSIQHAFQPFAEQRTDSRGRRRLIWLGALNRLGGLHRALEFPEHVAASTVKKCLPPDLYSRLFKFAFVRNPWDRLVSRYSYLLRNANHPRHKFVKAMKGFEDYLDWEIRREKMSQHHYVCGAHDEWLVDFVGYYERLHEDFAKVCARLKADAQLRQANSSSHRDYKTYYTPATRELVAKHFQRDIELFGYEFDGLPAGASPRGLAGLQK